MTTRFVLHYQKHVGRILEALRTHGPAILAAVCAETTSASSPQGVDCDGLLKHVGAEVQARFDALVETDRVHQDELADDGLPRSSRDEAALALNQAVVQLKKSTASLFGEGWVKRLTFPATVPTDPAQIESVGAQILHTLETTTLPPPQVPGVSAVDKSAWIDAIKRPYDLLAAARKDVTREEQEARSTLTARDHAIEALVGASVTAVQLTQSLARLGKVAHLVEGLRGTLPTTTSSSQDETEEETETPPDATPASPAKPA